MGGHLLADFQDKTGARLYFNTLIPFEKGLIKYGVISTDALLSDLLDWESLYAGGRLHKPVNVLEKAENVVSSQAASPKISFSSNSINSSII